jgi:hypothetical protein
LGQADVSGSPRAGGLRRRHDRYFRFRLAVGARFLPPAFLAVLADFFGDLRAGFSAAWVLDDDRRPPEKMVSQLSEYFFVAPKRTTLIGMLLLRIVF